MSAYAGHMLARGHEVHGSDRQASQITDDLRAQGAVISYDQSGSALPQNLDLLVYSEAIPTDAPERKIARERGVRSLSYFQALGELSRGTRLICVCGSHGKSSTTAMGAKMLMDCGRDPSVVVGTKMNELSGRNWRSGAGDLWIVEACEYRRSFLSLKPKIIVMTNIERDHFDAFPTDEDYDNAYAEFLAKLPDDGIVFYHGSDARSHAVVMKSGKTAVDVDEIAPPDVGTPGRHMQSNAQLVLALAAHMDINEAKARASLRGYRGSWRRMDHVGTVLGGSVDVIDDYAHHPTEIAATLKALKDAHAGRRLVVAFQPHTHDRTLKLWNEFAHAFTHADEVILLDVYDARPDRESESVVIDKLAHDIAAMSQTHVTLGGNVQTAAAAIQKILKPRDVCITMGAGSIGNLSAVLLNT